MTEYTTESLTSLSHWTATKFPAILGLSSILRWFIIVPSGYNPVWLQFPSSWLFPLLFPQSSWGYLNANFVNFFFRFLCHNGKTIYDVINGCKCSNECDSCIKASTETFCSYIVLSTTRSVKRFSVEKRLPCFYTLCRLLAQWQGWERREGNCT